MTEPMDEKGLDFGAALILLKGGYCVARVGWNGKGMWLMLVKSENYIVSVQGEIVNAVGVMAMPNDSRRELLPWIGMKTADNKFVPWLASQTDILAEDWGRVK